MRYTKMLMIICMIILIVVFSGCKNDARSDQTEPTTPTQSQDVTQRTTTTAVVTTQQTEATTATEQSSLLNLLHDISSNMGSRQIIISYQNDPEQEKRGLVYAFEIKDDGSVEAVIKKIPVVFGRNGLDKQAEGDGRAPSGIFDIPFAFGTVEIEQEPNIEYRITTETDYWVDDVDSDDYNTWQTYDGDPKVRWGSFERLKINAYRLAFVIGYNEDREKGLGSAIFFHVWKDSDTYTSGCTAAAEQDVTSLIIWLDEEKNPVIVQGSIEYYDNILEIDIRKELEDDSF